jgi:O-antigen ligase
MALWAVAISTGGLATIPHLSLGRDISAHMVATFLGMSGILLALVPNIRLGIPARLTLRTSGILLGYPFLVILVWLSLLWSESSAYGMYKAKLYAWTLLPVLGIPLVIDGARLLREFLILVWLCLFVACVLAFSRLFRLEGDFPFRIAMGDPITQSRAGAMLVILSWYLLAGGCRRLRLLAAIGSPLGLAVCVGTGTRGSAWALPFAVLVGVTWGQVRRIRRRIGRRQRSVAPSVAMSVVSTLICIWLVSKMFVEESHSLLKITPRDIAANSRVELAKASLNAWWEAPILGQGIGSFALYSSGWDERSYPHNMILEVLAEQGIVGFALTIWILGAAIVLMSRTAKSDEHWVLARSVITMVTYSFAISLVSMESPNQIFLWTGLGICCSLPSIVPRGNGVVFDSSGPLNWRKRKTERNLLVLRGC